MGVLTAWVYNEVPSALRADLWWVAKLLTSSIKPLRLTAQPIHSSHPCTTAPEIKACLHKGASRQARMERAVTPGSGEPATKVALPPAPSCGSTLDLFKVLCKHGLINPLNHPRTQYYY